METDKSDLNVLDPRGQPSGIFGRRIDPGAHPGSILDPDSQPTRKAEEFESLRMAPRLSGLDGKVVYLVDTGFMGSRSFLEEVAAWFSRHLPTVKIELRSSQGTIFTDDPALWAEIEEKGDAAVIGVGG